MGNIQAKVECRHCKEVFILPSMTYPLPVHNHLEVRCPGSDSPGKFLSIHQSKKPHSRC
jgi:hypothetical protein